MREITDRQEVFICQCQMLEHQFVVTLFDDENPNFIYISIESMLNPRLPWYKKITTCLRYLFGFHIKNGLFDNMLLKDEDVNRLQSILDEYKEKKCLRN